MNLVTTPTNYWRLEAYYKYNALYFNYNEDDIEYKTYDLFINYDLTLKYSDIFQIIDVNLLIFHLL